MRRVLYYMLELLCFKLLFIFHMSGTDLTKTTTKIKRKCKCNQAADLSAQAYDYLRDSSISPSLLNISKFLGSNFINLLIS